MKITENMRATPLQARALLEWIQTRQQFRCRKKKLQKVLKDSSNNRHLIYEPKRNTIN